MNTIYSILGTILPFEAYQFTFMKNAFLAILLLTPLLGLLGTMAVNHQMAFFSDALGHSALTGIGLGIILGLRNDLAAMLIFGIIWAVLICLIKQSGSASTDTVISVFSSTSVAAGLLILARGGKFAKYSSLPKLSQIWMYVPVAVAGAGMILFELEQVFLRIEEFCTPYDGKKEVEA